MKRLVRTFGIVVFAGVLGTYGSTRIFAASGQTATTGSLTGTASSSSGQAMPNSVVQLRNLGTGQLNGTTTTNALGHFSFVGLNTGSYVVEVVNAAGQIVGTSAVVTLSPGFAVTDVSVTASAAVAAASPGASAASSGATGGRNTAAVLGAVAAAAGVAVTASTTGVASPSQ